MLDFDYLILSNQVFQADEVRRTVEFFSSVGIRKFYVAFNVDLSCQSFRSIRSTLRSLQEHFDLLCPRGIKLAVYPSLALSKDAVKNPCVSLFGFGDKRIMTDLPWMAFSSTEDWLDENLNHLVRKNHLSPIFLSFERFIRLNDPTCTDRLLRASGLSFGLDLNFITATASQPLMEEAIIQNISIFPVISNDLACYRGIERAMQSFRACIGDPKYYQFCRSLQRNGTSLKKQSY